jgi:GNAT superfamily N-acetyltransferase
LSTIRIAESDEDIGRCFPVMVQLRTRLDETEFLATVRRQEAGGYRLAFVEESGQVCAVAGFRILDTLSVGRKLYVDDLVTDESVRSRGHGKDLFDWLVERARRESCRTLELDSGVQRFGAHRFYLSNRMTLSDHHFSLEL